MENRASCNQTTVDSLRHLVKDRPTVIRPDASLHELLEVVARKKCTTQVYVVNEEGKLCGTVPLNCLIAQLFPLQAITEYWSKRQGSGPQFGATSVQEIMVLKPRYVTPNTPLCEMARSMMRERVTELPIVDDRMVLLGIVGAHSAARSYLRRDLAATGAEEHSRSVGSSPKLNSSLS